MAKVLLISRSEDNLTKAIVKAGGHDPQEVLSFSAGFDAAKTLPYDSIIVAEFKNSDGYVTNFMQKLQEAGLHIPVIVHSSKSDMHDVVQCHDCSPLFATFLHTATLNKTLVESINKYLPGLRSRDILPGLLFQQQGEMSDQLKASISKVGPLTVSVTISGEGGLGKGRVAQAIHENSPRRRNKIKFVSHCKYLLNSDKAGHCEECYLEKCFAEAQKGTIVLIDLSHFCSKGQAVMYCKLHDPECDARVIATVDKDVMKEKVDKGEFMPNLWYELSQGMIEIDPIRNCPENIEWLVQAILDNFADTHKRPKITVSKDAMSLLKLHSWPGNVMELNSYLIQRASLCEGDELGVDDFIDLVRTEPTRKDETERDRLVRILRTSPTMQIAAKRYGMSERTVYHRMKEYGIDRYGNPISESFSDSEEPEAETA